MLVILPEHWLDLLVITFWKFQLVIIRLRSQVAEESMNVFSYWRIDEMGCDGEMWHEIPGREMLIVITVDDKSIHLTWLLNYTTQELLNM